MGRKQYVIAEFTVPYHLLPTKKMEAYLKALVVRYSTDTPEEMLNYYARRRKGQPSTWDVKVRPDHDLKRNLLGYSSGDWECYAYAMRPIEELLARNLMRTMAAGKS